MNIFKPVSFGIKELMNKNSKSLTFLVGAGISCEPPSCLASSRQFINDLLLFGTNKIIFNKLKNESIRFEYLVSEFLKQFKPKLELSKYFDDCDKPNIIHRFLAKMIKESNIVLTTNFDNLIEKSIGLNERSLRIVITRDDYKKYWDFEENLKNHLQVVYKIHGSLRNPKTGEDTRDSLIMTVNSLGKNKDGKIFSIEPYKLQLFHKICTGRNLCILGYSGGDDFDIIPTLYKIKEIQAIIWFSHNDKIRSPPFPIFSLNTEIELNNDEIFNLKQEDLFLYKMSKNHNIKIFKVLGHTASIISNVMNTTYQKPQINKIRDSFKWLNENIEIPKKAEKLIFAGRLFHFFLKNEEALEYFKKAKILFDQINDKQMIVKCLRGISAIYWSMNKSGESNKCLNKAFQIVEDLDDQYGKASILCSLGNNHQLNYEYKKALDYFLKSLKLFVKLDKKEEIGILYYNIGSNFERLGKFKDLHKALDYFNRSYGIFESLGALFRMAKVLGSKGVVYKKLGEFNKALNYIFEAYKINKSLGYTLGIIYYLIDIGRLYRDEKEFEKSIIYLNMAYKLSKNLINISQSAQVLLELGIVYRNYKSNKALLFFNEAKELFELISDKARIATILNEIGLIYLNNGESKKSLQYFRKSFKIFKKLNNYRGRLEMVANNIQLAALRL